MKKFASFLLALVILLSLAMPALAAETEGKIVISETNGAPVAGRTFNAYRILDLTLDATGKRHAYAVPAELEAFYKGYAWPEEKDATTVTRPAGAFTEDELKNQSLDQLVYDRISAMTTNSEALYDFAKAALTAAQAAVTPVTATGKAGETTVTLDKLPLGYYLIQDTGLVEPVSALMLDTTNYVANVTIKADKPTLEKTIDGDKDTDPDSTGKVDVNTAAIGDSVPFVLDTKVPDMSGYNGEYYFIINDSLSDGLTYNKAVDMVITVGSTTLVKDTHYKVEMTPESGVGADVTITFLDFYNNWNEKAGQDIVVTYQAILNEKAKVGVEGNENIAKLTYSNDPSVDISEHPDTPNPDDKQPPVGITPVSDTFTYVTELNLLKVDGENKPLAGADFTVEGTSLNTILVTNKTEFVVDANGTYYLLKDGTYTQIAPDGENDEIFADLNTKYSQKAVVDTVTKPAGEHIYNVSVGEDGTLKLAGLQQGTYTITEVKAPDGYNKLKSPIVVTIDWVAPAENETTCDWTYSVSVGGNAADESVVLNGNLITVKNQAGLELPSTGGMGTTLFYIVGGGLMLAALILLITKKRMNAA